MSTADTERLMRATDVTGLPVVTIAGGDDIAEIKDVVYDAGTHSLIGFTLNKRGWFRGTLRGVLAASRCRGHRGGRRDGPRRGIVDRERHARGRARRTGEHART